MPDDTPLSAPALAYLSTLEGSDYPKELVASFPRIVNSIVALRDDPVELRAYMNSLVRDLRGGRKGFPLGVLMDIQAIKDQLVGPEIDAEGVVKWF